VYPVDLVYLGLLDLVPATLEHPEDLAYLRLMLTSVSELKHLINLPLKRHPHRIEHTL
jgi:hypothetical protein